MPRGSSERRRKKRRWFRYIFTGYFLKKIFSVGNYSFATTFVTIMGVSLALGYLIGNIEPMSPETEEIVSGGEEGTESKRKGGKSAPDFMDRLASSFAGVPGLKWNLEKDGRIKVVIPYKRESIEEPENYEDGENIFYITPSLSGQMPVELETKRNMSIYGYSKEKGKGTISIDREGVVIKMRDKEALIRVPKIGQKVEGQKWQNWEVEWRGSPGVRNFRYQAIETDQSGQVLVRDSAPASKTEPSGGIRPRSVMRQQ
ncbi:MAG: hypothetical protein V1689_08655 [Pseudomonadota bacterium]